MSVNESTGTGNRCAISKVSSGSTGIVESLLERLSDLPHLFLYTSRTTTAAPAPKPLLRRRGSVSGDVRLSSQLVVANSSVAPILQTPFAQRRLLQKYQFLTPTIIAAALVVFFIVFVVVSSVLMLTSITSPQLELLKKTKEVS